MELPGLTLHEPAYVRALDWLMCDALARVAVADGRTADSHYFRLTTRPLDQGPFEDVARRIGDESLIRGVRTARVPGLPGPLRACFPHRSPIVTVHDASSHALAWLGGALGVPLASLGVDAFGRSGGVQDLRRDHDLDAGSIVNAALGVMGL